MMDDIEDHHQVHQPGQGGEEGTYLIDVAETLSLQARQNMRVALLIAQPPVLREFDHRVVGVVDDKRERPAQHLGDEPERSFVWINRCPNSADGHPGPKGSGDGDQQDQTACSLTDEDVSQSRQQPGQETDDR